MLSAPEGALLAVELEFAEVMAARAGTPGIEVHVDPDATWVVTPGAAWGNAGIALRFSSETVERRLDEILARYAANGRGAGFWVSPFATPTDLPVRLKARGLHNRKRFPAMHCDFTATPVAPAPAGRPEDAGLRFERLDRVEDYDLFLRHPHPYHGRMESPLRRFTLAAMSHRAALRPRRDWDFVALRGEAPVGFVSVFCGSREAGGSGAAGIHDVGVLPTLRRQGIGTAVMLHALRFAAEQGYRAAVLVASGAGYDLYRRVGFREVGRIAYWYRSPHAGA